MYLYTISVSYYDAKGRFESCRLWGKGSSYWSARRAAYADVPTGILVSGFGWEHWWIDGRRPGFIDWLKAFMPGGDDWVAWFGALSFKQ